MYSGAAAQQKPEIVHIGDLQKRISAENDTLYIVNFWATWCRPCVAELPHFEKLTADHAGDKVKVLLVSLDFASDFDHKLVPFVKKRNLQSEVLLLDEPNYNEWVDKIAAEWSGALPATLLLKNDADVRVFHEGDFTDEALHTFVTPYIGTHP